MHRFILLLLLLTSQVLPDVIIRPREPEEKKFFLDISAVDSFPGKIFILSNLSRENFISKSEFTNLMYDNLIEIKFKSDSPVLYVFDGGRISVEDVETGNNLKELIKKLTADSITYLKTKIDLSGVFKKKYGQADQVIFKVKVEFNQTEIRAAVTSAIIIVDSEEVDEIPFEYESGLFRINPLLFGDVAPEPEGLFAGDLLYFLLPLAGVIVIVVIFLRRRSAGKKD